MRKYVPKIIWAFVVLTFLAAIFFTGKQCGKQSADERTAELAKELSKSAETIELTTGLYAKSVVEINDLSVLLDTSRAEVRALKAHLEEAKAKLLITEQISLRWKKAFEEALEATQTEEPGPDGLPRKRVDFEGSLGPIKATGHTLTDPPEAFLKLEQVVPLMLTMNLVQNKDGSWSTFVTSSDENVDVKIDLAGVNPLVLSEKWYQKLWVELSAGFLGDPMGMVGLRYYGDRFSFGVECSAWQTGSSCGGSVGFRIFK